MVDLSTFDGMLILYFCAEWCNACKSDSTTSGVNTSDSKATEVLTQLYERKEEIAKSANCNDIEIIQISADDNEMQFINFYSRSPWLAIPFEESIRIKNNIDRFNVAKIPHVAIVKVANGDTTIINPNAATDIIDSSVDLMNFPFVPSPITDISRSLDSYGFNINERPSLVLLMETSTSDSIKSHVYESLLPLAQKLSTDKIGDVDGPRMLFFHAFEQSAQANKIRSNLLPLSLSS